MREGEEEKEEDEGEEEGGRRMGAVGRCRQTVWKVWSRIMNDQHAKWLKLACRCPDSRSCMMCDDEPGW